jgi:hypothetical protein
MPKLPEAKAVAKAKAARMRVNSHWSEVDQMMLDADKPQTGYLLI